MKKIRIGKDIKFKWAITTNNTEQSLTGRKLTLEIRHTNSSFCLDLTNRITISGEKGNELNFVFKGKEQTQTGIYMLTLWENKGLDNQTVVDKTQAFELVKYTDMEG